MTRVLGLRQVAGRRATSEAEAGGILVSGLVRELSGQDGLALRRARRAKIEGLFGQDAGLSV